MSLPNNVPLGEVGIEYAEAAFGVEFGRFKNLNVFCPFCENIESSNSQSCSVGANGLFHCKSCGASGGAAEFFKQKHGGQVGPIMATVNGNGSNKRKRKSGANSKHRIAPLTEAVIERCHKDLLRSTVELTYLMGPKRGLTMESIVRFQIGRDETRITIPTYNRDGSIYGLRRYLPLAVAAPKMVKHEGGLGGPILFPSQLLDKYCSSDSEYLVLCEGEWDAIIAIQHGFDALTVTSSVQVWHESFTIELAALNKPVIIIYDVNDRDDDLGQRVAWQRATTLASANIDCKVVRLPLPPTYTGGDLTNWFADEGRSAARLRAVIDETPWFELVDEADDNEEIEAQPRVESATNIPNPVVTLSEATEAKYFYKMIRMRCLVAGKAPAPYLVPAKIEIEVHDAENSQKFTHTFDPYDSIILTLINCSSGVQNRTIKTLLGIANDVKATITVLESMNIEELYLIPAIDSEADQGPYVIRQAYYVGHGIETNHVYNFDGYTLPHPTSQSATHMLVTAVLSGTDLDNFQLQPEAVAALRSTFGTEDVYEKMEHIADQLAARVTHIYGRSDLHIAVDLVFHSPLQFDFDGTIIRKGWLECLVLGDTRTGKGCITEGLVKYYGVGDVISGENLSFAGLVGGVDKVNESRTLVWGKIPLNDKRLVVLDECGSIPKEVIGKLSRIRSEGIAEVTKIICQKTTARTRLIWLSNPRPASEGSPRLMQDYTFGVEAVAELVGAAEDVARFDFVLTVSQNEVDSALINKHHPPMLGAASYTAPLCRQLIVWAWSRSVDDIVFDDNATQMVLQAAISLGSQFSPKICLVQSEDVRFKLARIAVAVACRTFSSPDGKLVIVTKEHVQFAYNFLHYIYAKPSCGYFQFSQQEIERSVLRDPQKVWQALTVSGDNAATLDLVNYFLENRSIALNDLCDASGIDILEGRQLMSVLIRARALTKDHSYYSKRPSFRIFLQKCRMKLSSDEHVTQWDESDQPLQEQTT
jgi:hypothetical protein